MPRPLEAAGSLALEHQLVANGCSQHGFVERDGALVAHFVTLLLHSDHFGPFNSRVDVERFEEGFAQTVILLQVPHLSIELRIFIAAWNILIEDNVGCAAVLGVIVATEVFLRRRRVLINQLDAAE